MKRIKQFRYFGDDHARNYPIEVLGADGETVEVVGISKNNLYNGSIFTSCTPITQLGIQSLPGTTFYLNNDNTRTNPIIIGYTGLYELNLEGIAEINSISFELESLNRITQVPNACLIVDIVYEEAD